MARLVLLSAGLCGLALSALAIAKEAQGDAKPKDNPAATFTLSGPYTHDNLTIFFLHGPDTLSGMSDRYLTLQEALEQKKAVVHETKAVNELSVENVSPDVEIYIQAGDVVKGGQQDRLLAYDLIVPPQSGKIPIASFCVESGRWTQRGGEAAGHFSSSTTVANSKDFKVAAQSAMRSQDQVWAKVREAQKKLSQNVGKPVASKESPTSLQLTLEDKQLLEEIDKYVKALAKAPEGKKDVIGYAVAINGQVEAADVYGSHALFLKLWPKLLNGSATEALAERQKDKKFTTPTAAAVQTFLADAVKGKKTEKEVTKRVKLICQEDDKNLYLEARDSANKDAVIHRSYLKK
jgi:hypothetical protein